MVIPAGARLRINHAFQFEDDPFFGTTYDGGVIEWSNNNGTTWNHLAAPGYTGTIDPGTGNPLDGP